MTELTSLANPDTSEQIFAPFTPEQIKGLQAWQDCSWVHGFTCGNDRGDEAHKKYAKEHNQHDWGILVPTAAGWVCPVCGYTQDWAWAFMANGAPPHPFKK